MLDTQPIDIDESGVEVGAAKVMEKAAKKCYTGGHCVKDANPILRATFDRAQMTKLCKYSPPPIPYRGCALSRSY